MKKDILLTMTSVQYIGKERSANNSIVLPLSLPTSPGAPQELVYLRMQIVQKDLLLFVTTIERYYYWNYYWKNMTKDRTKYVKNCHKYQAAKVTDHLFGHNYDL